MISIRKPGSPMCSPASPASRRGGFANCCHGIGAPMSGLSRRVKQLDEELLALGEETMLLEELDGFIAGLLVCPDLIKPGEWLPIIWNRDSGHAGMTAIGAKQPFVRKQPPPDAAQHGRN